MFLDYDDMDKFIKDFKSNDLFKELILRIRDKEHSSDSKQLVYYNGNKIFYLDSDNMTISFPTNVYKCNYSDISKLSTREEKEAYKRLRREICENVSKVFDFNMSGVSFKLVDGCNIEKERDKFEKFLEKHNIEYDKSNSNKYVFKDFNCSTSKQKANKIILVQWEFIKIFQVDNGQKVKKVNFSGFEAVYRRNRQKKENKLKTFIEGAKKAIDNYHGKDELEKKYQHQFMLSRNLDKLFNMNNTYYCEQEYGISVQKEAKNKNGRIDSIFYHVDGDKLTNIYLIELKVDDKVISNENGVTTHLDDIYYFLNDAEALNDLKNIIKYRHEKYYNQKIDISSPKFSFYTVLGFTSDGERESGLTTLRDIYLHGDKKAEGKLKNLSIKDLLVKLKEKDIKFFYEEENWDVNADTGILGNFKMVDFQKLVKCKSIEGYLSE